MILCTDNQHVLSPYFHNHNRVFRHFEKKQRLRIVKTPPPCIFETTYGILDSRFSKLYTF